MARGDEFLTRRRLLAAGGLGLLAGCTAPASQSRRTTQRNGAATASRGWKMYGYGPAQTAHNPRADVAEDPFSRWRHAPLSSGRADVLASPVVTGDTILVGGPAPKVFAVGLQKGHERWSIDTTYKPGIFTPAIGDGTAYVPTTPFKPSDNGELLAVDIDSATRQWSIDVKIRSAPTLDDGRLYFRTKGDIVAHDPATGDRIWTGTFDCPTCEEGYVRHGHELTTRRLPPAVADGRVYVSAPQDGGQEPRGHLYAFDAASGKRRWHHPYPGPTDSAPTVANGQVYVGTAAGLRAVDARTGELDWTYSTGGPVSVSPAATDEAVFVGHQGRKVECVGVNEGESVWATPTKASFRTFRSNPVVSDDRLYFGDISLRAFDIETGEQQFSFEVYDVVTTTFSPPTLVGNSIVLSACVKTEYYKGGYYEHFLFGLR